MDIVHQDNGTVGKVSVHNRVIIRVRIHQRPVLSIQRPHKERLLYNIECGLVCRSIGRPGHCSRLSAGLHQSFIRSLELGAHFLGRHVQKSLRRMIITVVSDLAADIHHTLHCGLPLSHILSQHEEGRVSVILLQAVQKLVCILPGTVVKGKGDPGLMLFRVICSVFVEIQIVETVAHPSRLYVSVIVK